MNKKRGITTIDWFMSLSIFLLYISWFFIYIRPVIYKADSPESLYRIVQEGLENDIYWTVSKQPLFIASNLTLNDAPIIANFNLNWQDFAFNDNRDYIREGSKIAFLSNITNNTIVWLASSEENYTRQAFTTSLAATESSAFIGTKDFNAEFSNKLLSKITYKEVVIQSFDITVGDKSISELATNRTYNKTYSIAYYKIATQAANNTNYIFAENTQIEGILTPAPYSNATIKISATLKNYTAYYVNGNAMRITNLTDCANYTTNYIDYYDSNGISFITQEQADYKTCYTNQAITLEITIALKNETRYSIILHTGNYNKTLNRVNYYTTKYGMTEKKKGVSLKKTNSTNSTIAATLRARWNYPTARDFAFALLNSSGGKIHDYTTAKTSPDTNIYVKDISTYNLDKYGNKEKSTIRIKTW